MVYLGIAAFGALGALARYWLGGYVAQRSGSPFPWGTFLVNVTGALALGVLVGLRAGHGLTGPWRTVLGAGFCGAFTTFSTWSLETVRLNGQRRADLAWANLALSTAAGLAAAAAGLAVGRLL